MARLNGQAAARGAMVSGGVRAMPGLGGGYVNEFRVNEEACVGCNLCSFVCPVTGCITMVERPSPLPSMTWREYQRRLAAGTIEKIPAPKH